ncbi:iron-sulfur cluster carrier protein ApbC [Alteromonas gilva]|uniref:Iron-sulfur cluster carrier protein n=1 Tax=Alteromonas gilva TaxID=2987522 RepID=A0ABT5L473_9ALTE|nr:iron-sulfur cluster carrier protein ApbC [Alteromonas gilva]MDC8830662.1 iron-sulfur cluster carrier protein ApbC [Alteromonas gilva]
MFFSRKSPKPSAAWQAVVDYLADYFVLPKDEVTLWCSDHNTDGSASGISITFPFANQTQWPFIQAGIARALQSAKAEVDVTLKQQINAGQTAKPPVTNIRNIIAVASGKGGVGKSTTSINMAFALMQEGARVGILDADIYGPSVPIMLGNTSERPSTTDNKHMQPLEAHGLVANSIGYLVPADDAAVWRGPMASKALSQLLNETRWPVLDYLIVDMPPGTGDIQLTMAQQVPLTAALVVTTPQDLAIADAQKGIAMFNKVNIPVLGLVENMSYYQCTACGHKDYIFAKDGGNVLAERYGLPLLGALPLDIQIREHAGSGKPLLLSAPDGPLAEAYRDMARAVSLELATTVPVAEAQSKHIKGDPIAFNPLKDN